MLETPNNSLPTEVTPVTTAIPVFIGYTQVGEYEGKRFINVPQKISSLANFERIFCSPGLFSDSSPSTISKTQYYIVKSNLEGHPCNIELNGDNYAIVPDPCTVYYLYNSVRLFYDNGGKEAYIVSVGCFGSPSGSPMQPSDQIINPNIKVDDLLNGLASLHDEVSPTMYVCPEATLLTHQDYRDLMQKMLLQNTEVQTAISIFDVKGGRYPNSQSLDLSIDTFRNSVAGSYDLGYGAAYFPFINTDLISLDEICYTNLFSENIANLLPYLSTTDHPNPQVESIVSKIEGGQLTPDETNKQLLQVSKRYVNIMNKVLDDLNLLPTSAAIAGGITTTDQQGGPWSAPANIAISKAVDVPINISDAGQSAMNVDAATGVSINAIRPIDKQIMVWGARTLDGNSYPWSFLPVKRTEIFIKESCKLACQPYAFQPNDIRTWAAVSKMVENFLEGIWKKGGLQGPTAEAAYSVSCGLGTSMTSEDILNGFMKINLKLALAHPDEFVQVVIQQEMATSG